VDCERAREIILEEIEAEAQGSYDGVSFTLDEYEEALVHIKKCEQGACKALRGKV